LKIDDKVRYAALARLQSRSALYDIGLLIAEEAARGKWVDVEALYREYARIAGLEGQSEKSRSSQVSKLRAFRKAGNYFRHDAPKALREWRRKRRNVDYKELVAYLNDAVWNGRLAPIP
jgi:hypothetical protein